MYQLLNTLYVMTPNAYAHLENDTLRIDVERQKKLQVPLHHLGSVVCFGNVMISPALMHRCADDGISLVLLNGNGRFKARLEGAVSGNILLRRHRLANSIRNLPVAGNMDVVRGIEGGAAKVYFSVLPYLVRLNVREHFPMDGRSRRPPRDRFNALLSFLYSMVMNDCRSALESVGLDPQLGFLHAVRPGRAALALDLMEEFRAILADRLALTLINRGQITVRDLTEHMKVGRCIWKGMQERLL